MTATLANGGNQDKRRKLDFYPTPPDATHALMRFLNLSADAKIWEPACGNGAMSEVIKQYCPNVYSSDVALTGYGIERTNFLESFIQCDAIITNPPFNISEEFIEHAVSLADTVAMLLKSQYWHAKKRVGLFERCPPAWILPLTWRPDFMNGERGGAPTMEVQWTVWEKPSSFSTRYHLLQRPI